MTCNAAGRQVENAAADWPASGTRVRGRVRNRRKPIAAGVVEAVLSRKLDELEAQLTRNGYDLRSLVEQFDAKPAEIRRLLRGDLDGGRAQELMDEMRAAGLPT
jgi:hypothetical protein